MITEANFTQTLSENAPFELDALPETLRIPPVAGRSSVEVVRPLVEATVDDLAFAIQGMEAENLARHRRLAALRRLYELTRERGALGASALRDVFPHGTLSQGDAL